MGWCGGAQIAEDVWSLIRPHIPAEKRRTVAGKIVDIFEDEDADTHYDLGNVLKAQGKSKQAAASYRRALRLSPGLTAATNNLAWMLATHPDPELRDGLEAVRLAERACQPGGDRHPTLLDTLAAAYAEAGRLDEAVETAQKALIRATETNRHELAGEIRGRLKVYESGLPYREVPPAGSK